MKIFRRAALLGIVFAAAGCEPLDETDPIDPPDPVEPADPADPGDPPPKKVGPITSVTPKTALLGQKLTVMVAIAGDKPGPGSEVTFGPGIDVIKALEVDGGLAVDIIVEADAASGHRDVTVAPDDAAPLTAPNAFTIASAMDVTLASGKAEQGGLVRLNLATRDGRKLAPATFVLDSLLDTGAPTLFQIARGAFADTTGSVVMLGDPLAQLGPLSFLGTNDPTDPQSPAFFAADAATVTARTAVTVASGVASNVTLSAPLQTALYSVNLAPQANEGLLVDGHARLPAGSTMKPVVYGYPATGKLDDILDVKQDVAASAGVQPTQARVAYAVTAATTGFFVVFDKGFLNTPSTRLTFDFRAFRATTAAEQAGAHVVGSPQNLGALPAAADAVPGRIVTGSLDTPGEVDVYLLSGFPGGVRDIQVSILADAEVDVIVDHVSGFDNDPTTFSNTDRGASGTTSGFSDPNRYIRVSATLGATKRLGKYVLGVRAVN